MMKKSTFVLLLVATSITVLFAQPSEQTLHAMRKLHFLQGVWKGEGWILKDSVKQSFTETETVSIKLNGAALQIEALGLINGNESQPIVSALGIISYDQANNAYLMRVVDADGSSIDPYFVFTDRYSIEWGLTDIIRFTIQVKDNKWLETGYKKQKDATWKKTFEIQLTKQ